MAAHGLTSVLLFTREYTRYLVRAAELITAVLEPRENPDIDHYRRIVPSWGL